MKKTRKRVENILHTRDGIQKYCANNLFVITLILICLFLCLFIVAQLGFFRYETTSFDVENCTLQNKNKVLFLTASSKTHDTVFSKYLVLDEKVSTTPLLIHVKLYPWPEFFKGGCIKGKYSHIPWQIKEVNNYWEQHNTPKSEREFMVKEIIKLWKDGKSDKRVDDYINQMLNVPQSVGAPRSPSPGGLGVTH